MKGKEYAAMMAFVLSVAVILAFATTPASAASMQGTEKSQGSVSTAGMITEPTPDVFYGGEGAANAERDRRFLANSPLDWHGVARASKAAAVSEPNADVFYGGEAGATAERDRRFSDASRVVNRLDVSNVAATKELTPGIFYNGEHGATAERDRRASEITRGGQRGEMAPNQALRPLVYQGPSSEWFDPWAAAAGAGGPLHQRHPWSYEYWFAPLVGN
jgi:hypothetical protein